MKNKETKVRNIGLLLLGFTVIIIYKISFKHLTQQRFSINTAKVSITKTIEI